MKKQRVLIVHNYYQVPGGEDTVVENEKNLLIENGHEVLFYTRDNDEIKKRNFLKKLLLSLETIFSLKTYREVKKLIKKEKIQIVHVHNTLPLISPAVYYAAKSCGVPVVQTIHNFRLLCPAGTFTRDNMICEECVEKNLFCSVKNKCYRGSLSQSLISAITLYFHRIIGTYNNVDAYIALTEFNKNKLSVLINQEKIFVKPNFVDFDDEGIVDIKYRKYFLYLGRVDKLKGVDLILKAWRDIKDEHLYIVGTGPFEKEANKYVIENNMDNVKFLGFKKKDEVIEILKKSKALIMASQWYEPFGMTIIEGFSFGIPAIVSEIGNVSGIIRDEKNGLVYKHEDLIKKIERINEIELLKNLSRNAYNDFKMKYNKEINYENLIKIYSAVGEKNEKM